MNIVDEFLKKYPEIMPVDKLESSQLDHLLSTYGDQLPQDLLELWKRNSFCGYLKGLFWTINPEKYQKYINIWLGAGVEFSPEEYIPVIRTAFGNIIVFNRNSYGESFCLISPSVREYDSYSVFENIEELLQEIIDKESYRFDRSIELDMIWAVADNQLELKENQCFRFIKPLYDGGEQAIDNFEVVDFDSFIEKETAALIEHRLEAEKKYQPILERAQDDTARQFKDAYLMLALHNQLGLVEVDRDEIVKEITGITSSDYAMDYDPIEIIRDIYLNHRIPQSKLDEITELSWSPSEDIISMIYKNWDGEDDYFTINSFEGIEQLTNLKEITIESISSGSADRTPLVRAGIKLEQY